MTYESIEPGTQLKIGDVTLYAGKDDGSRKCTPCAFDKAPVNGQGCGDTNCNGVMWLTQQNYLIHRLTN